MFVLPIVIHRLIANYIMKEKLFVNLGSKEDLIFLRTHLIKFDPAVWQIKRLNSFFVNIPLHLFLFFVISKTHS